MKLPLPINKFTNAAADIFPGAWPNCGVSGNFFGNKAEFRMHVICPESVFLIKQF
jgi:hypothetical protein